MEEKEQYIFKIAWAYMPLTEEEIETIPYSHRKRPYLLCMDMGDYYYAFPATSNVYNNKTRYENEKIVINNGGSLIKIGEVSKLPKDYLLEYPRDISEEYSNEIIKKINACISYSKYPQEFIDFFMNKEYYLEENDIVEHNGELYLIIETNNVKYYLHRVYPYPVNGSVLVEMDGCKYYIDISCLYELNKSENLTYYTRIGECSLEGINIKDWLLSKQILRNQKDYTQFNNLVPGMVIDVCFNNEDIRMVILEKHGNEIEALYGSPYITYSNYQLGCFSNDNILSYSVFNTLSDERLEKLRSKHTRKEYTREKKYK